MSHAKFQTFLERNLWDIIENGLRPILDTFAEQDTLFDLQDIFQRFTFDAISKLLLDYDPKSLSIDLPHVPCEKAFNDVMDALMYRHILPEGCWKLQKWLRIGKEKQLIQAWEAFDQFLYPCISRKQEELMQKSTIKDEEFTFLNAYIKMYNQWKDGDLGTLQTFLRDTFLNLMLAGRDTTSEVERTNPQLKQVLLSISKEMYVLELSLPLLVIIMCFTYSTWWYLSNRWWKSSSVPTNWPLVGMLPGLIRNAHRVHEFVTDALIETKGTFEFHGPVLANLNMLLTSDPANIHHILSKNFSNYPKGVEFRKIFDMLGNGMFSVDYELWEMHRKTTMSLMNHAKFQTLLERNMWSIIENGLRPVLDVFAEQGTLFDLQDIFQRFTFDAISKLLLDHDPKSLSIGLPHVQCENAFNDSLDALMYRHFLPESCWKLQKWLRIGKEKKLIQAWEAIDQFLYPCISRKQEELMHESTAKDDEFTFLNAYIKMYNQWKDGDLGTLQTFLRDTFLSLMFAGRDTTSAALTWFFWLLAENPLVEKKIREEIQQQFNLKEGENLKFFEIEEARKLVYLHGALCETLRFFPSVAIEHKLPLEFDILPSGHHVSPNTRVVLSFYMMGRMESIWGKYCLEFKPERWISERGGIKHEPSVAPRFSQNGLWCTT